MPIHDWTLVDAGLFHHFHQEWTVRLCDALNAGALPPDYFALVEQKVPGPVPDVLTLKLTGEPTGLTSGATGLAVAEEPPKVEFVARASLHSYAAKANRLTVRHRHGGVVAIIEVVSPGNKASASEFRALLDKLMAFLQQGIHLLLIDLFPPTPRDPNGIHAAIWQQLGQAEANGATPSAERSRMIVAYSAGSDATAYVERLHIGDILQPMPLFLTPEVYVPAPLENSYMEAWRHFPRPLRGLLQLPDTSA